MARKVQSVTSEDVHFFKCQKFKHMSEGSLLPLPRDILRTSDVHIRIFLQSEQQNIEKIIYNIHVFRIIDQSPNVNFNSLKINEKLNCYSRKQSGDFLREIL